MQRCLPDGWSLAIHRGEVSPSRFVLGESTSMRLHKAISVQRLDLDFPTRQHDTPASPKPGQGLGGKKIMDIFLCMRIYFMFVYIFTYFINRPWRVGLPTSIHGFAKSSVSAPGCCRAHGEMHKHGTRWGGPSAPTKSKSPRTRASSKQLSWSACEHGLCSASAYRLGTEIATWGAPASKQKLPRRSL